MRKSVIGIFLSIPLACGALAACSSDSGGGNDASAGKSNGGSGGASAGAANGGAHSAGKSNGDAGETSNGGGGSPGAAGDTSDAGAGGAVEPEPMVQSAVYTMSNNATANQIFGFLRADDGSLTPMAVAFATGGKGSGAALGEQGAVAYDVAQNRIYTVNAGDDSFSVFGVNDDGTLGTALNVTTLGFGSAAASLLGPKSITFHGDTVYVLYEGTGAVASMIAGWTVAKSGATFTATAIAGSALALSSDTKSVDPAQIEFTPDGKWLVVSEKQSGAGGGVAGPGMLDSFAVNAAGLATKKGFYPTAKVGATDAFQLTPFGFEFLGNTLVVSEAGSTGTGTYTYDGGVIAPVATGQFLATDPAPCWVAVSGNYAYVTNAKGPNISGFTVSASGALGNIGPITNAIVASTGEAIPDPGGTIFHGPTDEFVSQDGKYLYVLNSAVPSIGVFAIEANGTLARVGTKDYSPALTALPKGAAGIVAR
jgi:6-phosphogluconolactonase (cycloisomerase 2 family)